MENLVEKLKSFDSKKQKTFEIIFGIISGLLVWITLIITGETKDQLISLLFLVVFVALMLLRNKIQRAVGWKMRHFTIAMCISLGASIAVTAVYWLITGKFNS